MSWKTCPCRWPILYQFEWLLSASNLYLNDTKWFTTHKISKSMQGNEIVHRSKILEPLICKIPKQIIMKDKHINVKSIKKTKSGFL